MPEGGWGQVRLKPPGFSAVREWLAVEVANFQVGVACFVLLRHLWSVKDFYWYSEQSRAASGNNDLGPLADALSLGGKSAWTMASVTEFSW